MGSREESLADVIKDLSPHVQELALKLARQLDAMEEDVTVVIQHTKELVEEHKILKEIAVVTSLRVGDEEWRAIMAEAKNNLVDQEEKD